MRRFASSSFILLILLLALWVLLLWYIGERTEAELKRVLEHNSQQTGEQLLRVELVSYKKNLLGADASLRISSEVPIISKHLGELQITAKMFNGPIFLTKSGIDIGSSRWFFSFGESNFDNDDIENLLNFFPADLPSASVNIDFDQKVHYSSKIDTLWFKSVTNGFYDLKYQLNRGSVDIDKFKYGALANLVLAEKLHISYQHQKPLNSNYKPDSTSILIPELIINHKFLASPVIYSVKVISNIVSSNKELSGFIKIIMKRTESSIQINTNLVDSAQISLLFKGISSDGLIKWYEVKSDLDNLQQQSQWLLEEQGELPEGQDQIWQLQDRIEMATKELPKTFKESVFNHGKSQIHFDAWSNNSSGTTSFTSDIFPTKTLPASSHLSSFLQAQAKVTLDDLLYQFLATHTLVNKKQFILNFNNNQILMQ